MEKIQTQLGKLSNPTKAKFLQGYFKTGKGEYGEGDIFIGITVPNLRKVAKEFEFISIEELTTLIRSKIHEERLLALLILGRKFHNKKADEKLKKEIYEFYIKHLQYVNNWDLVDEASRTILGSYLLDRDRSILYKLVKSKNLWERRNSIIATFVFLQNGESEDTIAISKELLEDKEDLMHKAVGWMLREMGKRVDVKLLEEFLNTYKSKMPRTMLRYAIERLPEKKRKMYLSK
ncbi:MAG TPA: DNA alkylation repair protein [Leptospiraceae bacterium]|nr:DNA alkylation repair protein [Leptospiraceae bacterium]